LHRNKKSKLLLRRGPTGTKSSEKIEEKKKRVGEKGDGRGAAALKEEKWAHLDIHVSKKGTRHGVFNLTRTEQLKRKGKKSLRGKEKKKKKRKGAQGGSLYGGPLLFLAIKRISPPFMPHLAD